MVLYWLKYTLVKSLEGAFILFSFFSGAVIIAHFLKHVCSINFPPFKWMLNDGGDYGAEWWLKEKGYKKGLYSAFWWWMRNPVWEFKHLIIPKQGKVEIVKVYKHEVKISPLYWVLQDDRGTNHVYFKQGGQFNGRYSHTNDYFNLMMGSEGRYIFKLRRSK